MILYKKRLCQKRMHTKFTGKIKVFRIYFDGGFMKKILKNVLFLAIFALIAILVMDNVYKQIGYGYFKKALSKPGVTFFTRDNKYKYSNMNSYKIENKDYNNSTFYKKIKVKRNTPYRITCMIKTENVNVLDRACKNSGAKISLLDLDEQSKCLTGTNDWTKVTLIFNSKQNDEISVGFMLGSESEYGNVSGTAWFSDLQLEEGKIDEDTNWNVVCFMLKNLDITILNRRYKYSMSETDVKQLSECVSRFKKSCEDLSNGSMTITYNIIEIETPLNSLSYDEEKGYYINPADVEKLIDTYIQKENYDHIFICSRLNDEKSAIKCNNWIGLGSMEYKGIGFSNIRMPTSSKSEKYVYNDKTNQFPEEVFVHEFLHSLEKNSEKYGYSVPALHDYEKYGYYSNSVTGLYDWFKAYMTSTIGSDNQGLSKQIYKLKPIKESNFKTSTVLDEFEDVTNIFERLKLVIKTINTY